MQFMKIEDGWFKIAGVRAGIQTHTHNIIAASFVYSLKVKHLLLTDYIWQAYCMRLTLKYQ